MLIHNLLTLNVRKHLFTICYKFANEKLDKEFADLYFSFY